MDPLEVVMEGGLIGGTGGIPGRLGMGGIPGGPPIIGLNPGGIGGIGIL